MENIREIVSKAQEKVYEEGLLPDEAVDLMRTLSAVYGNVLSHIQKTELLYNRILLAELDKEKVAAKAKIVAQVSKEYQDFLEAKNTEKLLLKMLSSLKTFVKSKTEEFKSGAF